MIRLSLLRSRRSVTARNHTRVIETGPDDAGPRLRGVTIAPAVLSTVAEFQATVTEELSAAAAASTKHPFLEFPTHPK